MTKKKVLILSASIGTGHTQAARAIEEYVKTSPEECEVEHALINNANFYVFVKLDKFVCHEYAGCTCTDNNYVIILSHNYFLSNQNPVYFSIKRAAAPLQKIA